MTFHDFPGFQDFVGTLYIVELEMVLYSFVVYFAEKKEEAELAPPPVYMRLSPGGIEE